MRPLKNPDLMRSAVYRFKSYCSKPPVQFSLSTLVLANPPGGSNAGRRAQAGLPPSRI